MNVVKLTTQRTKSTNKIAIKSPFKTKLKNIHINQSKEKYYPQKTNPKNILKTQNHKNTQKNLQNSNQKQTYDQFQNKNKFTINHFQNQLIVSNNDFNKLKQQLQNTKPKIIKSKLPQSKLPQKNQRKKSTPKLKVKILDRINKKSFSNSSDKTKNDTDDTTQTLQSEQIEMLKTENQYFKKIYEETLKQLSKLQNKLRHQKKVHALQKQVYETQINKLRRIVEPQNQEVTHIIRDEQGGSMIIVSVIKPGNQTMDLGLDSDCEDNSIKSLSIDSKQ